MQRLSLYGWTTTEIMPALVTGIMLASQCSSLLELDIVAPAVGLAGPEIAAVAALTRLRRLQVTPLQERLASQRSRQAVHVRLFVSTKRIRTLAQALLFCDDNFKEKLSPQDPLRLPRAAAV